MKDLSKKDIVVFLLLGFIAIGIVKNWMTSDEILQGYSEEELQMQIVIDRLEQQNKLIQKKDEQLERNSLGIEIPPYYHTLTGILFALQEPASNE